MNVTTPQSWAPASRFTLTRYRVIDDKAKNRRVTQCWEFFLRTRCRVTFEAVGGNPLLPPTTSPASRLLSPVYRLPTFCLFSTISFLFFSPLPPPPPPSLSLSSWKPHSGGIGEVDCQQGWRMTAGRGGVKLTASRGGGWPLGGEGWSWLPAGVEDDR